MRVISPFQAGAKSESKSLVGFPVVYGIEIFLSLIDLTFFSIPYTIRILSSKLESRSKKEYNSLGSSGFRKNINRMDSRSYHQYIYVYIHIPKPEQQTSDVEDSCDKRMPVKQNHTKNYCE